MTQVAEILEKLNRVAATMMNDDFSAAGTNERVRFCERERLLMETQEQIESLATKHRSAKRQLEAAEELARLLDTPNQNDRRAGRYQYDWNRVDAALAAYEAAKGGDQ